MIIFFFGSGLARPGWETGGGPKEERVVEVSWWGFREVEVKFGRDLVGGS